MPTIYIFDSGDDKNDGLSLKTPIYSLKQAKKLQGGETITAGTSGLAHGNASTRNSPTRKSDVGRAPAEADAQSRSIPSSAAFSRTSFHSHHIERKEDGWAQHPAIKHTPA